MDNGNISFVKSGGKLKKLNKLLIKNYTPSSFGIGHTRWTTERDKDIESISDYVIYLPDVTEMFSPIFVAIPCRCLHIILLFSGAVMWTSQEILQNL